MIKEWRLEFRIKIHEVSFNKTIIRPKDKVDMIITYTPSILKHYEMGEI